MKLILKDIVWNVLKDNEYSRDDDMYLLMRVWGMQGFEMTEGQKSLFMKLAKPESIARLRREIQEAGFFKASSFKQAQRSLLEMRTRDKYRRSSF